MALLWTIYITQPYWMPIFFLTILRSANYFFKMRKRTIFIGLRHEEENFLRRLRGGAGKQQLAQDENKMLGDEEIRNTKELDLIKSRIKALF